MIKFLRHTGAWIAVAVFASAALPPRQSYAQASEPQQAVTYEAPAAEDTGTFAAIHNDEPFADRDMAAASEDGGRHDGAPALGLEEVLALALDRNLSLRQSANDVALSETTVDQERSAFYPNLSLSAGPSMRLGRGFDQSTGTLYDEGSESLNLSVSSSINLFNGFADVASLKEANLGLEASESSFARAGHSILYQTTSQYMQVFLTEELIRVEEENLESQRQQLASIEAAYDAGNRPIADVLRQRATIAQAEQRLIAAQRDYEVAKQELKKTLHLSPLEDVSFEAPSEDLLNSGLAEYDMASLVQQALSSREDIAAQRLRIEAADQGISVARAGYYPSVSLSASAGSDYSSRNDQFNFGNQLSSLNPSGSVGLSISIPIFSRGQTSAAVGRAKVSASNQQLALEELEQDVAYEVQQALLDYRTAQAQLRAAERQVDAAQEALAAAEARYDVGASTLLEVNEARSLLIEAATGRLQARYDVLDNELAIAFSAGTLDEVLTARLQ